MPESRSQMFDSLNRPPGAETSGRSIAGKRRTTRLAFPIASLLLFILLAVVHTWPLATAPGRLSRNDAPDTVHKEWILAWDAHQLAHDPFHLLPRTRSTPSATRSRIRTICLSRRSWARLCCGQAHLLSSSTTC